MSRIGLVLTVLVLTASLVSPALCGEGSTIGGVLVDFWKAYE